MSGHEGEIMTTFSDTSAQHSTEELPVNVISLPRRNRIADFDMLPLEWPKVDGSNALKYLPPAIEDSLVLEPERTHTSSSDLPSARQWSMRLVHGLVEVMNGMRPLSQLTRWLTVDIMHQVKNHIYAHDLRKLVVRSVHVSETNDGVAEVCAVFGTDNRCYALAMRLEGLDGRWRVTQLMWGM